MQRALRAAEVPGGRAAEIARCGGAIGVDSGIRTATEHLAVSSLMSNWPVFVVILAVLFAAAAFIHAAMTKDDVRSALGWSAIALLSPFVGAFIYAVFGINRVSRSSFRNRRARSRSAMPVDRGEASPDWLSEAVGANLAPLITLGDRVTTLPITAANSVTLLDGGDETYGAMIEAISNARRSVYLETYIFDDDPLGQQIAEALAAAAKRDVDVRVLIDAVGARYSRPPITRRLGKAGVRHAKFLGRLLPLRLPYANLRSHRKIMIIDGEIGFAGGMNIRDEFARSIVGDDYAVDTHFRLGGPIVSQLGRVFASDWHFSTGEELHGQIDMSHPASSDPLFCRAIDSGPDDDGLERTMGVILGALAIAKERVLICSPYFLPDVRLVAALAVAARRGVRVDIVIPERSNLRLVGWAITLCI